MLYINKKNGSIVDTKALIEGESWEPLEKPKEEPKEEKKRAKKKSGE